MIACRQSLACLGVAAAASCARASVPVATTQPSPPVTTSAPAPVASVPVAAVPVASAPSATPPSTPSFTLQARQPPRCSHVAKRKEHGVVPDDLMDLLQNADETGSTLPEGARCVAALHGDASADLARSTGCEWGAPTLLALDPVKQRVAVLMMPAVPTAGGEFECQATQALTFDIASARSSVTAKWPWSAACDGRGLAISRVVAALPGAGFTSEAKNLVIARAWEAVGATGHSPAAVLDAPLCGSILYVAEDDSLHLVSPANDASTLLGTLMVNDAPTLDEVVLSPDHGYLVLLVSTTPGGHNLPLGYSVRRFALPKTVKLVDAVE